jgi:GGDEF domain-containing protein
LDETPSRGITIVTLDINGRRVLEERSDVSIGLIEHLQILIRGIALHAVEGDPEDLKFLRGRMSGIADSLTDESSPDDLLVAIGKTLRAIEEYNRRSSVIFKGQMEELRAMLSTMAATVMFITSSSDTSVKQLRLVEAKLQRATNLEDMRQVKAHLSDCLSVVRSESTRLQTETRTKINALKSNVERLSSRLKAAATEDSSDPVTGLPGRSAAEEAIATKITAGREFVTALFMLDRMASINGRFGRTVGDEILITGAQMLAQKLTGTTLYRWSGPAFVAVFDPTVNTAQAEICAKQAASLRLEKNIDTEDRTVLIVITASCHLQRVSEKTAADAVFKSIDAFMSARGSVSAA